MSSAKYRMFPAFQAALRELEQKHLDENRKRLEYFKAHETMSFDEFERQRKEAQERQQEQIKALHREHDVPELVSLEEALSQPGTYTLLYHDGGGNPNRRKQAIIHKRPDGSCAVEAYTVTMFPPQEQKEIPFHLTLRGIDSHTWEVVKVEEPAPAQP